MCNHAVQFYDNDTFLVSEVSRFVLSGLRSGHACLVIATKAHRDSLAHLMSHTNDTDNTSSSLYLAMDAEETLSRFMVNDMPDEQRFKEVVGSLIHQISGNGKAPVSAFGEMVALLYAAGKAEAALRLEELWNKLAHEYTFTLLCAYPMHLFHREAHAISFKQICSQHTQVRPAESYRQSATHDQTTRYVAELQQKEVALRTVEMAHKISEEALQIASVVYRHSSEAMMVCDDRQHIIAINPAFSTLTGYEDDDMAGRMPDDLFSGQLNHICYDEICTLVDAHGSWQGEVWSRRKNGSQFVAWVSINSIRHPLGHIHRYIVLFSDITEKKLSDELIWKQANFDALTDLPNRRLFRDRLEQEIKKGMRTDQGFALLFIDLDHFKEINDTLGHDMGDRLLLEAARRLKSCVRDSDTVARLGGDEFTVIITNLDHHSHAEDIAQKILLRLSEPFYLSNQVFYLSASIGITLYPADAIDYGSLLKNADQAMYVAKTEGRNRFSYFTRSMQLQARERLKLRHDLYNAITERQVHVYFQPIVDLETGRIVKAEALLRWQHAEKGWIPPSIFIPIAEESGMIKKLGDWVFKESVLWAALEPTTGLSVPDQRQSFAGAVPVG